MESPSLRARILTVFSVIFVLTLSVLSVPPVFAARIFVDGFESGDFSKWTVKSGRLSVTSGNAHHGTYKAVLNESGEYAQARFTSVDHCFMRAYVMFKSFPKYPAVETPILGLFETLSGVYLSEARVSNVSGTFKWRLRYFSGTTYHTVTSEQQKPALNTWYCVEVESKSNTATNAESRIYIDGNELTDVSQAGKNNTRKTNCAYILESVTSGVVQWYDCVIVDTAYVGPERYLTVVSPYGTTGGQGWYNDSQTAYATLSTGSVNQGNGTRRVFTSWSGDASGTDYASSNPITMNANKTAAALWKAQYQLTFASSGLDSSASGSVVNVNSLGKNYADLPYLEWFESGAPVTYSYSSIVSSTVTGKRFILDSVSGPTSPITVTGPASVSGGYKTQYYLNVTSPYGSPSPASGWYDEGSSITSSVISPWPGSGGTRYACTGWMGTGSVPSSGIGTSVAFTLTDFSSISWNWKTQYQVAFAQTGIASDCTRTIVMIDGANYDYAMLAAEFWWDDGSSHSFSFSSPLVVNAGKQYNWASTSGLSSLQSDTLTINGSGSVTGNYGIQIRYHVIFHASEVAEDFMDTVVIIDDIGYAKSQLPRGFWWDEGSSHSFSFQSPLTVAAKSKQYVWTGTTGLSTLQNGTIIVLASGDIIAHYKIQYYFEVASPYDSPTPASGWFDAGTEIVASVSSPVGGLTGTRYICTGWTGTGDVPASGIDLSVSFTMTQGSSIMWNWKTQHVLAVLTHPEGLSPQPTRNPLGEAGSPNSWWYDNSSSVSLTAHEVDSYTFNYWTLDDVSQGSAVNPIIVTINSPRTAVAHYSLGVLDIAVLSVQTPKTVIGQSYFLSINVTVGNQGDYTESFNVTLYANTATIAARDNVILPKGSQAILAFTWDTTGFAYGNYTISAYATPILGENDTADNTLSGDWVVVSIPGDVVDPAGIPGIPDGKVDLRDVFAVGRAFGAAIGNPRYNPNLDINGDGKVDLKDYYQVCKNYGKSW